jgi:hypothetical protein
MKSLGRVNLCVRKGRGDGRALADVSGRASSVTPDSPGKQPIGNR